MELTEDRAYLVESRLYKILADYGFTSFDQLYTALRKSDNALKERIIDAITTNETMWFRDKIPWKVMEDILLPVYIEEMRAGKRFTVRIWSAACSTGQEPYSVAICIDNFLKTKGITDIGLNRFEILASDISHAVLEIAKLGKYDGVSILRGLDPDLKKKYFYNQGGIWILKEELKNMVRYRRFNILDSFNGLGIFDLVFCRHVLFYFSSELRKDIIRKIIGVLEPKGTLFLGASEVLMDYRDSFTKERYENGFFYQKR